MPEHKFCGPTHSSCAVCMVQTAYHLIACLCTFLRSKIRPFLQMKAVGVSACNDANHGIRLRYSSATDKAPLLFASVTRFATLPRLTKLLWSSLLSQASLYFIPRLIDGVASVSGGSLSQFPRVALRCWCCACGIFYLIAID